MKYVSFFDTDMHIHRLSADDPVRIAASKEFELNRPSAISEFSLVELKGNYIQCMVLLRRKIEESFSFENAYSKVSNTGGRRAILMLSILIKNLGGLNFPVKDWKKCRNILLTFLDSQIAISWELFCEGVDIISSQFNCSRAKEEPQENNGKWTATIPKCRLNNTECKIDFFLKNHIEDLKKLYRNILSLKNTMKTDELYKISNVCKKLINGEDFPKDGKLCRQIGDLLIGLDSKIGNQLISSNYKEHSILSKSIGYTFKQFPYAAIRSK